MPEGTYVLSELSMTIVANVPIRTAERQGLLERVNHPNASADAKSSRPNPVLGQPGQLSSAYGT